MSASFQSWFETFRGEGLKSAAEATLEHLGNDAVGRKLIELYAFGVSGRVVDPVLNTTIGQVELENPVMFGAGWDKKGRAVHGLYQLGFSGGDIGTVLPFPQRGNPKPRLWTITPEHDVGFNSLGFNSIGMECVGENLEKAWPLPCPIGLNVGRNKEIENDKANWAHEKVIARLGKYASYIVLGISSPNTRGLRDLQSGAYFDELIHSAKEAAGDKDVYAKVDSERTTNELDSMIESALTYDLAGFIATNTYAGDDLKSKYDHKWVRPGGLSGNDPEFRRRATATVKHAYEAAGDKLTIIGVGGVCNIETALEKIKAGASAVQVVTAIRPSRGKVAAQINRGLLAYLAAEGAASIRELVGTDTVRGSLR